MKRSHAHINGMSWDDVEYHPKMAEMDTKYSTAIAASGQIYEDDPRSRRSEPMHRELPQPIQYDRGGESMT